MRVFLAGASGAIGSRLVPRLIDAGHEVVGTHTSPRSGERVRAGEWNAVTATEARGASNAKARRELGWTPRHPTWRTGFFIAYASNAFYPAFREARSIEKRYFTSDLSIRS